MKNLSKREIIFLAVFLLLLFLLPFVVFTTGQKKEIRPKALTGQANFLLSSTSAAPRTGENFEVLVSLQLTQASLRVSGVDFLLLYDKDKLDVVNVVPQIIATATGAAFDDAPIVSSGGDFPDQAEYKFLRVAEVARRPDGSLAGGTVSLAKVTFFAKAAGAAQIKFPDDNKYLTIVGTSVQ